MTIKPGDQWKAVVLGLLIIAFGVYAYISIGSTMAKNASTPPVSQTQVSSIENLNPRLQSPESGPDGIPSGASRRPTDADVDEENTPTPQVGRDPFQPPKAVPIPASELAQQGQI